MHCAQYCNCRPFFLVPGTRHHRNWRQWCFTPHIWGWYCAASALRSFPRWFSWFRHCSGRAHGEGTLACTCQKMGFARPNDFEIIILYDGGNTSQSPQIPSHTSGLQAPAGRMGALVQSVVFHILWLLSMSDKRNIWRLMQVQQKSPVLEYRTRNEVTERKGAGRAQVTSSLVPGALGEWGKNAAELRGAETSHPLSPAAT